MADAPRVQPAIMTVPLAREMLMGGRDPPVPHNATGELIMLRIAEAAANAAQFYAFTDALAGAPAPNDATLHVDVITIRDLEAACTTTIPATGEISDRFYCEYGYPSPGHRPCMAYSIMPDASIARHPNAIDRLPPFKAWIPRAEIARLGRDVAAKSPHRCLLCVLHDTAAAAVRRERDNVTIRGLLINQTVAVAAIPLGQDSHLEHDAPHADHLLTPTANGDCSRRTIQRADDAAINGLIAPVLSAPSLTLGRLLYDAERAEYRVDWSALRRPMAALASPVTLDQVSECVAGALPPCWSETDRAALLAPIHSLAGITALTEAATARGWTAARLASLCMHVIPAEFALSVAHFLRTSTHGRIQSALVQLVTRLLLLMQLQRQWVAMRQPTLLTDAIYALRLAWRAHPLLTEIACTTRQPALHDISTPPSVAAVLTRVPWPSTRAMLLANGFCPPRMCDLVYHPLDMVPVHKKDPYVAVATPTQWQHVIAVATWTYMGVGGLPRLHSACLHWPPAQPALLRRLLSLPRTMPPAKVALAVVAHWWPDLVAPQKLHSTGFAGCTWQAVVPRGAPALIDLIRSGNVFVIPIPAAARAQQRAIMIQHPSLPPEAVVCINPRCGARYFTGVTQSRDTLRGRRQTAHNKRRKQASASLDEEDTKKQAKVARHKGIMPSLLSPAHDPSICHHYCRIRDCGSNAIRVSLIGQMIAIHGRVYVACTLCLLAAHLEETACLVGSMYTCHGCATDYITRPCMERPILLDA
jgi:hypothetical protein